MTLPGRSLQYGLDPRTARGGLRDLTKTDPQRRGAAASDLAARPVRHRRPRAGRLRVGRSPSPPPGRSWWQILPLGPTGYGDSPYQCFSAFAGNPFLLSPELLAARRPARRGRLPAARFPTDHVDFGPVIPYKQAAADAGLGELPGRGRAVPAAGLRRVLPPRVGLARRLRPVHGPQGRAQGRKLAAAGSEDLVRRKPAALDQARRELAGGIGRHKFGQFLFARQWSAVKAYAHERGVRLIGDVPIFVASDSADVWANGELFQLDADRRPTVVAGVPPDYFSPTGQLWGNPHYDWAAMKRDRLRLVGGPAAARRSSRSTSSGSTTSAASRRRGRCPPTEPTAEVGDWAPGPGADLLTALQKALGGLPLIAEDLGVITPEVEKLRDDFGLPGMRILQFAFSDPDNRFLPHHYDPNTVVYTGTHDNDTTVGWYDAMPPDERAFVDRYLPGAGPDIAWELIRLALASVADYAIVPLQDILSLPTAARMNYPGRPAGNWGWRFTAGQLTPHVMDRLADLTALYLAPAPGKKK